MRNKQYGCILISMAGKFGGHKCVLCAREVTLMERQMREAEVKHKQALKGFLG